MNLYDRVVFETTITELKQERDDARRWAAAWKESARANHDAYQNEYLVGRQHYQVAVKFEADNAQFAAQVAALHRAIVDAEYAYVEGNTANEPIPRDALRLMFHGFYDLLRVLLARAKGES